MKQNIPLRQTAAFSVLFLIGANMLIGGPFRAKQDAWLSLVIIIIGMILWGLVLARLSVLCPGKNIFDLLSLLPKKTRCVIAGVLIVYCIEQAGLVLRSYAGFTRMLSLPNTPLPVLLLLSCLIVYAILRREDGILYRFSYVVAIPIGITVLIMFLLQVPMFRTENLFPVLYHNTKDVFLGAWDGLSYPYGNAFLLLGLAAFPEQEKKARYYYTVVILFCAVISGLILMQCLLLIGGELSFEFHYPYDFAASLINIRDFFSRIETFAALLFYISVLVRSAWFSRMAIKGIQCFAPVKEKSIAFPFSLFLCAYSCVMFRNTDAIFDYLQIVHYFYPIVQYGLPVSLWILAERNARRDKLRQNDSLANPL